MAKKNKVPSKAASFEMPDIPQGETRVIPDPSTMRDVRERVGLSQSALARECQVSHDLITNYELGRTKLNKRSTLSIAAGLKIWRVLEIKERALKTPAKAGERASDYVLGLLWLAKAIAIEQLAEIEGHIQNLQMKHDSVSRQIAEIAAEETELKNRPDVRDFHGVLSDMGGSTWRKSR